MTKRTLDDKDRIILKMIARTTAMQQPSPSIREMMAATGLASTNYVRQRLIWMCKRNYLTRNGDKRTARSYCIHPERIAHERKSGGIVRQFYQII
jgi:SOS-response transcriptional repressor LexA